jgi:protein TonB
MPIYAYNHYKDLVFMKKFVFTVIMTLGCASLANAGSAIIDNKTACKPEYPKSSLMNEEQGVVVLSLLVNPDGSVSDSKVERSSGFKNLDKAAQKSLSACKFKPSAKAEWQTIEYKWTLE